VAFMFNAEVHQHAAISTLVQSATPASTDAA
jgi:hypothetical protein